MKIFGLGLHLVSLATVANCQSSESSTELDENAEVEVEGRNSLIEKRYQQLVTQMNFYNKNFDPRKYWGYGCNCFTLGDRPMSEGLGNAAVDELDETCKSYKECLKCAAMAHGSECVPEMKKYKFYSSNDDQVQCRNKAGTCERALCECDNMFARTHTKASESWNINFHTFWGGWNSPNSCKKHPKIPGSRSLPKSCCNNPKKSSYYSLYTITRQECCSNGEVAPIGMC